MEIEKTEGYARLMAELEKRFPALAENVRENNVPFERWWPMAVWLCENEKVFSEWTDRAEIDWNYSLYAGH